MKCSRCRRWIQGQEIKFAVEGDWIGKPLCKRCKIEVEKEARDKYRKGLAKQYSQKNQYRAPNYGAGLDEGKQYQTLLQFVRSLQ